MNFRHFWLLTKTAFSSIPSILRLCEIPCLRGLPGLWIPSVTLSLDFGVALNDSERCPSFHSPSSDRNPSWDSWTIWAIRGSEKVLAGSLFSKLRWRPLATNEPINQACTCGGYVSLTPSIVHGSRKSDDPSSSFQLLAAVYGRLRDILQSSTALTNDGFFKY